MKARLASLASFALASVMAIGGVAAQDTAAQILALGREGRPVELRVDVEDGHAVLVARASGRDVRAALPVSGPVEATFERVVLAGGEAIGVMRGHGSAGDGAAIVALSARGPRVLWSGRTDLHGDPGERTADVLSLEDRTGDGAPDVVVGLRSEGSDLCGEQGTIAFARALDVAQIHATRGAFRPVVLSRLPHGRAQVELTATATSPGPSAEPLIHALSMRGASSTAGAAEDATALAAPRALTDGDPATFWAEGRGGTGRGELVVGRFDARVPIRAFALRAASGPAAADVHRPRALWIAGEAGPWLHVAIPAEIAADATIWIVPTDPLSWNCVALVIDEAEVRAGAATDAIRTGLGEIAAYTDLDFGGGIDRLVTALIEGGNEGDEAARLLSSLGEDAARATAAAWDRLDELGQRRAVRVLAATARHGAPSAARALGRAATQDSAVVRRDALAALGALSSNPAAGAELARAVREPAPIGDEAVSPLVRHDAAIAIPALLAALHGSAGADRAALREGLARSATTAADAPRRALEDWLASAPPIAELASVLLGLASHEPTAPIARDRLPEAIARAERFDDRYRLVTAARVLPSDSGAVDRWLEALARDADEWMLRSAAIEALATRGATARSAVARRALGDDVARVRVAAIAVLDADDVGDDSLAARARRDSWPMVRAAAIRALAGRRPTRNVVRRAIADPAAMVRRTAIEVATRTSDAEAWPLVRARLRDVDEWPDVTLEALHYVRARCVIDAGDAVLELVRRGMRPDAWPPDVDVAAVAVDLAIALGGHTADDARRMATRGAAPPSLRRAAERATGHCEGSQPSVDPASAPR